MSKTLKIVLIVFGCLAVVCSGIVGAGIYWYNTSGKQMMEQLTQGARRSVDEGVTFGTGKDDTACLQEALSRIQRDDSLPHAMTVNMFLASCLQKSKHTPDFCKNVPRRAEFTRTAQWSAQRCKELNTPTPACGQLMNIVQAHCDGRETPTTTR